jgi:hypothetical protein
VLIIYYPWRQIDDHAVPTTTGAGWGWGGGATTGSRVYITKTGALACRTQTYHLAPKKHTFDGNNFFRGRHNLLRAAHGGCDPTYHEDICRGFHLGVCVHIVCLLALLLCKSFVALVHRWCWRAVRFSFCFWRQGP